ncbi:hypothetical protein AXF42_Ash003427 [Apostasia shenzhenica]|uniref:Uncharacterized protein n=1 Tax=Apostasia shenzhenica TaxID=1088818 RepID=A0A2I0BG60_9ASPA|nr:hypothetical protein AXF42_Ash003427 [Apostasia shenzhenica]
MIVCRAQPPRLVPIPQISHVGTLNARTLAAGVPSEDCRERMGGGGGGRISSRRSLVFLSIFPASAILLFNASAASPSLGFDDLVTEGDRDASSDVSRRVGDAVRLLDLAREFQAKGDFSRALNCFTQTFEINMSKRNRACSQYINTNMSYKHAYIATVNKNNKPKLKTTDYLLYIYRLLAERKDLIRSLSSK